MTTQQVVFLGLVLVLFHAFSYNGVCFWRFIFSCMVNHIQSTHSFSAIFQSTDIQVSSHTHFFLFLYPSLIHIVASYLTHAFNCPYSFNFRSWFEPFWLTMMSLTESFSIPKHIPLYANKLNERKLMQHVIIMSHVFILLGLMKVIWLPFYWFLAKRVVNQRMVELLR